MDDSDNKNPTKQGEFGQERYEGESKSKGKIHL